MCCPAHVVQRSARLATGNPSRVTGAGYSPVRRAAAASEKGPRWLWAFQISPWWKREGPNLRSKNGSLCCCQRRADRIHRHNSKEHCWACVHFDYNVSVRSISIEFIICSVKPTRCDCDNLKQKYQFPCINITAVKMCNFPLRGSSYHRSGMTEKISGFEAVTYLNHILPWNW